MSLSFVHASSSTLSHSAINPTGGYCFKCGVNTTYSAAANALTGAASSGTAHIQLRIWTNGKLEVRRWSGSSWASVFSTSAVNDGNNHDIEIYHTTGASNNVLIYIDGKLDSTRTLSYTTSSTFERIGMCFGDSGTTYRFTGTLHYARLFNLSNNTLYYAYDFDEGSGSTANDNKQAYSGTLSGTSWTTNRYFETELLVTNDNKVFSYINETFTEVTSSISNVSSITVDEQELFGFKITAPTEAKWDTFLPKSFKVITSTAANRQFNYAFTPPVSTRELVVANGNILTSFADNIDYFEVVGSTTNSGVIKVAISNDNGSTWYTTNDDGETFTDLSITIPLKDYSELTEGELSDWEDARDTIYTSGITYSDVKDLDVTGLNTFALDNPIRFAYVIDVSETDSTAETTSLKWQIDKQAVFTPFTDTYSLGSSKVILRPTQDYDAIIINEL